MPNYSNTEREFHVPMDDSIDIKSVIELINEHYKTHYRLVGRNIMLPEGNFDVKSIKDLKEYVDNATNYKLIIGKKKKGTSIRKVYLKRKGFTGKERFYIRGKSTLFDELGKLSAAGIEIHFDSDVSNKAVRLAIDTRSVDHFVDAVCSSANVWCTFTRPKVLQVSNRKTFTISAPTNGKLVFQAGGGSSSGSDDEKNPASGRSMQYEIKGYSFEDLTKAFASQFSGVSFRYSPAGFYQFSATPRQYKKIVKFFKEQRKRNQVIYAEVQLLRVDLKDEYKWGVDWNSIAKFAGGKIKGVHFLKNNTLFQAGDSRAALGIFDKHATPGQTDTYDTIVQAINNYGDVNKVDGWYNQMTTGTPLPFSNYQLVRYYTVGASQGDTSTETTVDVKEDEVGFKGVLTITKSRRGYNVDGYIEQSFVTGYTELQIPNGGVMKTPNIDGKAVRIKTRLSGLNRTIIVGGFRAKGMTTAESGVPFLSRLPGAGYLFKNKADMQKNSEFIILITLSTANEGRIHRSRKYNQRHPSLFDIPMGDS